MPVTHVGLSPIFGPPSPPATPLQLPGLGFICAQGPPGMPWGWWELS